MYYFHELGIRHACTTGTTGVDTKQIHLVDHRASEALRLTSPEQKSLAQGTIISKIHSEP